MGSVLMFSLEARKHGASDRGWKRLESFAINRYHDMSDNLFLKDLYLTLCEIRWTLYLQVPEGLICGQITCILQHIFVGAFEELGLWPKLPRTRLPLSFQALAEHAKYGGGWLLWKSALLEEVVCFPPVLSNSKIKEG